MPLNETSALSRVPHFHVVEIGPKDVPSLQVECHKISTDGKYVAGNYQDVAGRRAFLWKDGVLQRVSNKFSRAVAVNRGGVGAGFMLYESHLPDALMWKDGKETLVFPDKGGSECQDIDDAGNIYGSHVLRGSRWCGFIRSADGKVRYIDEGTDRTCFVRCGNQGRVCAQFSNKDGGQKSVELYDGGKLIPLLSTTGGSNVVVQAISQSGVVVGGDSTSNSVPTLWRNGKPEAVKGMPATWRGKAMGINAGGEVVGVVSSSKEGANIPFLCRKGKCYDLDGLTDRSDLHFSSVQGISDNGVILATSLVKADKDKPHVSRGYLLVPE